MFVFDANGRVQKVAEGILFYEQDVLCSSYSFTGDQKIELNIDYMRPGFGIALIRESTDYDLTQGDDIILFKLGINDFRVIEKMLGKQKQTYTSACRMYPNKKDIRLTFTLAGKKVTLYSGDLLLGEYNISKMFDRYRIGFYSNAGNIIRSLTFFSNIPRHWRVSTLNTLGGRISFEKDMFRMENCEQEAEVQQEHISLPAGRYWLKYQKEDLNGTNDIRAYVFHTKLSNEEEANLEDEHKDILDEEGSFVVDGTKEVTLKFKGHNGIIGDICVVNNTHSDYVETMGEVAYEDGSEIRIKLDGLKRVKWNAHVDALPPWENLVQDCPYAIVETVEHRYTIQELGIELGEEYSYSFSIPTSTLTISNKMNEEVFNGVIKLTPGDNRTLTIMKNVTMTITNLILEQEEGESTDVVIQKTFKRYVPDSITSPIIVTREGYNTVFDLSSSYREVVESHNKIALFSREQPLMLKEEVPVNSHAVKMYGIPEGAKIVTSATDIRNFATAYTQIPRESYRFSGNYFTISDAIREAYAYLAVQYSSIDEFTYEFTNYEREVFDGTQTILSLEKPISKNNEDIIIYGIPEGSTIHDGYLYRVPNEAMLNSIDYYADVYDELPVDTFDVAASKGQIKLHPEVQGRYKKFIVDYLKTDSYCINHRIGNKQYEVDVATDAPKILVHYDMHEDGGVYKYIRTDIHSDEAGYVILRRKENSEDEN